MDILLSPIGWVRSSEIGPREDGWGEVVSEIVLDRDTFSPEALDGLSGFSHVEVLFHLHGVNESSVVTGRRHPRGNVQRVRHRPQLGFHALTVTVRHSDHLPSQLAVVEISQFEPKHKVVLPGRPL